MSDFLRLKKSDCKNCYKCIRNCPVKSIRFSGGQAHIIGNECILCGNCFVVCPQNAKEIVSSIEAVKVMIGNGDEVCVSLAPSFIANYEGIGIDSMRVALQKLGFSLVEETAIGATIVKKEYERILAEEGRDILISSCCHSINLLIQKYFPEALPYLANVVSPMQAHCLDIKKRKPNCKTVFIGPCLSKKDEADYYKGITDAVLTFDELTQWLEEEKITLEKVPETTEAGKARFFPTTGGILKTMELGEDYTYMAVDGVENCVNVLKDVLQGDLQHCFIEMSACVGSCVGGPTMEKNHKSPVRDYMQVSKYAGTKDFEVGDWKRLGINKMIEPIEIRLKTPSEYEIKEMLRLSGKTKPEHELNCGSCGYSTCREKAIAVIQGKADWSMCMPFLMNKAESFSDNIINNTPNGIIVVNESMEVQQINQAALRMMNLRSESDVLGDQVVRILDPRDFIMVQNSQESIQEKRVYLAEYKRYVDETILYDKKYRIIICIMRDVTDEEKERSKKESISHQTIEITDKVIDKQMRVVQEIASLLGETVAETKIALTKLKEAIGDE